MKNKPLLAIAIISLLFLQGAADSNAQLVWDANTSIAGIQDGTGTWNTTGTNWYNGSADVAWDSNTAIFGAALNAGTSGTSLGTITVGTVSVGGITFRSMGGYTLQGGPITLTGSATIDTAATTQTANNTMVINAVLAGSSGLTITNSGNLVNDLLELGGNNTFTGAVSLSGSVQLDTDTALGAATNAVMIQPTGRINTSKLVNIGNALTFTGMQTTTGTVTAGLNGVSFNSSVAAATVSGLITLDRQGTGTGAMQYAFRENTAGQTLTLSGGVTSSGTTNGAVIASVTAATTSSTVNVSGLVSDGSGGPSLQLAVVGPGVVSLSHATGNTYSGLTAVSGGATLQVNNSSGSGTGSGAVSLSGTATLAGIGILAPTGSNGITAATGTVVAPGNGGIGKLTLALGGTTGTAAFATGSTFAFDLGAPGTSDLLAFTGGRAGSVLFNNNAINFTNAGGLAAGTYTLFTFDGSGEYAGTLSLGTGLGAFGGTLVYNATNIELTVAPEPSSVALLALGVLFAGGLFLRRPAGILPASGNFAS